MAHAPPAEPAPLTPTQLAEAVALYRELQIFKFAGVKLVIVTLGRDGISVGSVNRRIDIASPSATLNRTT